MDCLEADYIKKMRKHDAELAKQEDIMIMSKELTNSTIERQNVLNNPFAVTEIQKAVEIRDKIISNTKPICW